MSECYMTEELIISTVWHRVSLVINQSINQSLFQAQCPYNRHT